ncbi:MAG: 2-iminoacetate synthase ThiH [Candidatus Omnitrophota bacterium]|jgi:2-iminoacetate synthase
MSYYDLYSKCKDLKHIEPDARGFLGLLSESAENSLEEMAIKSRELTLQYFGRTIQLYTPMYLSNHCDNKCLYCGFNADNDLDRHVMTLEEVEKEADFISSMGLKHILILTGESRVKSPPSYMKDCIGVLKKYFSSISVEVYPLTQDEYSGLVREGVDGLTIYQEVYNEDLYGKMHPMGPKNNYKFRLDAPERGANAGMRNINIGVLLGLDDWRKEVFYLGLHAKYLMDKFPEAEIGVSVPRIRPQAAGFKPKHIVSDKNMVQIITALRIFLPRLSISLSTRERPELRDNLIPLGITRMSAGSTTRVGGHTIKAEDEYSVQFEISDNRTVGEIRSSLEKKGYQAVFKDWMQL